MWPSRRVTRTALWKATEPEDTPSRRRTVRSKQVRKLTREDNRAPKR